MQESIERFSFSHVCLSIIVLADSVYSVFSSTADVREKRESASRWPPPQAVSNSHLLALWLVVGAIIEVVVAGRPPTAASSQRVFERLSKLERHDAVKNGVDGRTDVVSDSRNVSQDREDHFLCRCR